MDADYASPINVLPAPAAPDDGASDAPTQEYQPPGEPEQGSQQRLQGAAYAENEPLRRTPEEISFRPHVPRPKGRVARPPGSHSSPATKGFQFLQNLDITELDIHSPADRLTYARGALDSSLSLIAQAVNHPHAPLPSLILTPGRWV